MLRELQQRGTAGAVAEALGYSPSAVSQQLAQLQREVGVPLVEKVGRRLRLTPAGEVLAARAKTLLDEARRAEEEALAASGRVAGTVRIVAFQTALLHVLAPALPGLASGYPDLTVDVLDEEFIRVLQALALQEIDVALTDEHSQLPRVRRPELVAEELLSEPVRVALPEGHPLAASGEPVPLDALPNELWVAGHVGTNHADVLERACLELAGYRPDVRYRTNDIMVMFAMIAHGGAVSVMPDLAFAEQQPGVVTRPLAGEPLRRRMVMWTRVGADVRPSVRALLDALRASAGELAARRPSLVRGPNVPKPECLS
ncbi:LysR family transcriptional regulator [Actinomadura rupiterrae]|uniref:LysR family transcriptional regulator n=1 Tax=Actinomadura rupiterrae TaxID=559627 RepID=UPI0020A46D46|nr:LysR family transcriptional regulator [Actinomadura rupiterrae]MCP2335326.1 DNA-binding transcriptional LysR family regulator [Actinomadura rupiterrae]